MKLNGFWKSVRLQGLHIGTTKKAIGTTYALKGLRVNLRFEDFLKMDEFEHKYNEFYTTVEEAFNLKIDKEDELMRLKKFSEFAKNNNLIIDTSEYLHQELKAGKRLLAEGANGAMLDIDHGTYPFVTSSTTTSGGICTGLGIPPTSIETIVGTVKAYTTRVGSGPFPTELKNDLGEKIRQIGQEVGVTTGRPRRCGWLDLNVLRKSCRLNGYTSILVTKLDILSNLGDLQVLLDKGEYKTLKGWEEDISRARTFDQLPKNAQKYISFMEDYLETPVSWIGVGPEREAIIQKL